MPFGATVTGNRYVLQTKNRVIIDIISVDIAWFFRKGTKVCSGRKNVKLPRFIFFELLDSCSGSVEMFVSCMLLDSFKKFEVDCRNSSKNPRPRLCISSNPD